MTSNDNDVPTSARRLATDDIGTQIAGMQTATAESVAAIKEIGGTIGRVAEIASAIAAAVEEQGSATQEISRSVQHAAQGTSKVAANVEDVSKGARETGSSARQVLEAVRPGQQAQQRGRELPRLRPRGLNPARPACGPRPTRPARPQTGFLLAS